MKYYRTYNVAAGLLVVMFAGVMGMIWHFSRPVPIEPAPATVPAAQPAQAAPAAVPAVGPTVDSLLTRAISIDAVTEAAGPAESVSPYAALDDVSTADYAAADDGSFVPSSPTPSTTPSTTPSSSQPATASSDASTSQPAASGSSAGTDFGSSSGSGSSSTSGSSAIAAADTATDSADSSSDSSSEPTQPISTSTPSGLGSVSFLKGISVTVLSGDEKVLRDDISAPGQKTAELYCAKNETEAFQILVTNGSNYTLPDIEIHVSDWQGSGNKKPKLTLFREHYVKTTSPSYGLPVGTPVGWYPDALIPFVDPYTGREITSGLYRADHASVANRESQGYWADVRVDSDVTPGTYTCSILVTSSDRQVAEIPVSFTVWDFALPTKRQFITWWYEPYGIYQYYGLSNTSGEQYQILKERYNDMAYDHGVYPVPDIRGRTYNENDGTVTFSSYWYHGGMRSFVEKYGTGIIVISTYLLLDDYVPKSDSKILNTLNSYNNMIKAHLDQHGDCEYGQYVIYLDEPYKPERKAAVKKIKDLMNTIPDLHIKMMLTGSQYAYDILDSQGHRCADIWVCYGLEVVKAHSQNPQTYRSIEDLSGSFLHDSQNPDASLWTTCSYRYTDVNLLQYRDFAWYGYTFGTAGGFGWRLAIPFSEGDPWIKTRTYVSPEAPDQVYNGLSAHILPGNPNRVGLAGIGGPIATMRLKMFRRACEDFEYFKMLEGFTDKATVDTIVSDVVHGYTTYADPEAYDAARKKMAQLILEHQ